jgi:periplasmic mercuric ion binding protein
MKTYQILSIMLMLVVFGVSSNAQTNDQTKNSVIKTETIKVSGNCGMCKTRIEKAAKIDGVGKAEWSDETKILTLVYDASKVQSDDVQKKIAAVGHDTDKYKADDKTYNSLPGCCKYR